MNIEVDDRYLQSIHDELTEGFIFREYQLEHPQLTANYMEKAAELYHVDPHFHHKVDGLVAGVMGIIQKHIK